MTSQGPSRSLEVGDLYKEQHRWLRSWLRSRVDCSQLAADLVQDVFVRLLGSTDRQGRIEAVREPRSFLATVARRLMIDHFRRQRLERAWLQALAEVPEALDISAEDRLILMETLVQLDAMLAALGDKVRQAFLLSQLDGMTYRCIAQTLGVSLVTVNRYIAKASRHCMLYSLEHGL
ncbi:sigma-70 family RNA polymerase sigma factor [Pseudomonas sp. LABIM340]|uniref:sigma-70 family RNA polymerase sigma factor n=1 Tax=Pseudomonas sp. LABIM340 TaxID=3156585 RepID=UPI0032AEA704